MRVSVVLLDTTAQPALQFVYSAEAVRTVLALPNRVNHARVAPTVLKVVHLKGVFNATQECIAQVVHHLANHVQMVSTVFKVVHHNVIHVQLDILVV